MRTSCLATLLAAGLAAAAPAALVPVGPDGDALQPQVRPLPHRSKLLFDLSLSTFDLPLIGPRRLHLLLDDALDCHPWRHEHHARRRRRDDHKQGSHHFNYGRLIRSEVRLEPSRGRPRFVTDMVASTLCSSSVLSVAPASTPVQATAVSDLQQTAVDAHNVLRAAHNAGPLVSLPGCE